MESVIAGWIDDRRAAAYGRTPALRLQTIAAARAFVQTSGFCHFWPVKGVELPNLFHAIAGCVRDVPNSHDDPDISKCWGWKDLALDKRWWYYGKLIRRRSTLVALDLLPCFYACSDNYGDYATDHLEAYEAGRLSADAKAVYEVLLAEGPMSTVALRKAARMSVEGAKYRFEKAIVDLQVSLRVLPTGLVDAGAWHYAFLNDIVARWYPNLAVQARAITRREAQKTLILRLLQNVVVLREPEIYRTLDVLGWTEQEFGQVIAELLDSGSATEVRVQGNEGRYLADTIALSQGRGMP